jgi:histidine ammonia-lyase
VLHPDRPLTEPELVAVARDGAPVELAPAALEQLAAARRHVDALAASDTPVYGVSTGFGALASRHIPAASRTQLQRSLIRSHAASSGRGRGEVVRGLMLLRLRTLVTGRTGVRPETARPTRDCSTRASPRGPRVRLARLLG